MGRLSKAQLNQVKYVSMADYFNAVDQYEDFNDKLKFTTRYLLTHSGVKNPDYSIEQAIHLARVKLTDASIKKHNEYKAKNNNKDTEAHIVDPYSKDDKAAEMFMANPVDYLVGEANKTIRETNKEKIKTSKDTQLENECLNTLNSMSMDVNSSIKRLDRDSRFLDIKARMEAKFGGKEGLDKAYAATKGGFMSRVFGTSSTAAKNLDKAYKAFNNPNHALYGNIQALNIAAVQYIQHNFPNWQPFQEFPSKEDIDKLSETEKARMDFSINAIKSLREQTEMEEKFLPLVKACEGKDVQYSEIKEVDDHKVIDLDDSKDEIEEESLIDDDSEVSEEKLIDDSEASKEELIDDGSVESEKTSELIQEEFREQLISDLKEDEEYEFKEEENINAPYKEIEEEQIDDINSAK